MLFTRTNGESTEVSMAARVKIGCVLLSEISQEQKVKGCDLSNMVIRGQRRGRGIRRDSPKGTTFGFHRKNQFWNFTTPLGED